LPRFAVPAVRKNDAAVIPEKRADIAHHTLACKSKCSRSLALFRTGRTIIFN
jgi:hypothetical protein